MDAIRLEYDWQLGDDFDLLPFLLLDELSLPTCVILSSSFGCTTAYQLLFQWFVLSDSILVHLRRLLPATVDARELLLFFALCSY